MDLRNGQAFRWKGILFLCAASMLVVSAAGLSARAPFDRPEWDQKKAVAIVRSVLALEKTGQPWDRIPWLTPEEAVERARKENKPLLVYCFLETNVGPAAAPC